MEINRQAEELKANVEVAPAQPPNPTPKHRFGHQAINLRP
jgi:hypothetical protein